MKKLILATAITFLAACSSSDDDSSGSGNDSALLQGIQSGVTTGNVAEAISALETTLNANDLNRLRYLIISGASIALTGLIGKIPRNLLLIVPVVVAIDV